MQIAKIWQTPALSIWPTPLGRHKAGSNNLQGSSDQSKLPFSKVHGFRHRHTTQYLRSGALLAKSLGIYLVLHCRFEGVTLIDNLASLRRLFDNGTQLGGPARRLVGGGA